MSGTHVREIENIAGLEIMFCLGPVLHAGSIGLNQAKVKRLLSCVLRNSLRQRATNVECGRGISVGTFDEAGGYEAEIQLRRSTKVGGSYVRPDASDFLSAWGPQLLLRPFTKTW